MDIVSHALIGRMVISGKEKKKDIALVTFAGAFPDLFQIPLYAFVGYINARPFWFPHNADWTGVREAYPAWYLLWDIPHSLLFLAFVITPLVLYFKLNKLIVLSYFLHI